MKENFNYYKNKIYSLLFIIALTFGMHGLYVYYRPIISKTWQLISAIIYGTFKLFVFYSPIPAQAEYTITYEIAKWLAPILTSALVLTKITNTFLHLINQTRNKLSHRHIIIFEKNDISDALILNLLSGVKKYNISLISNDPIPDEWKKDYEKKGIAAYEFNFNQASPKEINALIKKLKFNTVNAFIFCAETDLENYALFLKVLKNIVPQNEIKCFINCESHSIPLYLEEILNQERKNTAALSFLDIIPFNQNELTVRLLLNNPHIKNGILRENFDSLSKFMNSQKSLTPKNISEALGEVHFLILGVNELTVPLILHSANNATISLDKKIKICILDPDADKKLSSFLSSHEEIFNTVEIKTFQFDSKSRDFKPFLRELKTNAPPTAIFLLYPETVLNLEALTIIDRYFYDTPKALRNISGVNLQPILPKGHEEILVFGDILEIMNEDILIQSALDKRAKEFNISYNEAASAAGLGQGSNWEDLSQTKKTSSRASAAHAKIKEEILKRIYYDKDGHQIKKILNEQFEVYQKLNREKDDNSESFKYEFSEFLANNPVLDFLSQLEHKRWCNSYYAMNFKYGKVKDEFLKTHPCLIEDWNSIMDENFYKCHPEYDLIASFALFPKEKNNE
ncbi:MAG: hypothetical protein Q4P29_06815 [Tissierellia bacterium]|nr:hypothetical protein [Tissierellia bacterium]